MDARAFAAAALVAALCPAVAVSATYQTKNFVITADSPEFARQVGEAAEYYRHHLAVAWLGQPLPGNWKQPCPIRCRVGRIGAGGATTFTFNNGHVFGWNMDIQGSEERILDSVLPHEISHMIFACHFRRPLPRWADEGAATLVEHESERMRQTKLLNQVIRTSRRIPLRQLLTIKEYPRDMQDVLTLYAEGYSLADYLVQKKGDEGRAAFLAFLGDALDHGWQEAFETHYGITDLESIEHEWTQWVLAGSPELPRPGQPLVADNNVGGSQPDAEQPLQVRGQSPDSGGIASNPAPLARLTRPRRQRTAAPELQAPPPVELTAQAGDPQPWEGVPTRPISVHPARPATAPPSKFSWPFPWPKRDEADNAQNAPVVGFSNPTPQETSPRRLFDFSR